MLSIPRLKDRLDRWEKRLRETAAAGFDTPEGRSAATWHFNLFDHAFLRTFWTNEVEIAPGVWRANQPGPRRIAAYARRGIRSIISLRGSGSGTFNLFEGEACARHSISFEHLPLGSTVLPPGETLLRLLDLMRNIEKPVVIHCKSGADRTGLAAALYLIDQTGASPAESLRQLHWRHVHFRGSKAGVLGRIVEAYGCARAATGISLRDWLATGYDPLQLSSEWRAKRTRS